MISEQHRKVILRRPKMSYHVIAHVVLQTVHWKPLGADLRRLKSAQQRREGNGSSTAKGGPHAAQAKQAITLLCSASAVSLYRRAMHPSPAQAVCLL